MRRTLLAFAIAATVMIACGNGGTDPAGGTALAEEGTPKGEQLYRMHCVLCHGASGKLGFNAAKDLTASTLTRAEMIARVSEGKGTMQAYKHVLTPREIEAVVDHVRRLAKAK